MNEKDQSIRGGADRTDIINILEALGHKVDKTVTKTKTETKTETKTKTKTKTPKSKMYYYSPDGTLPKKGDQTTKGHRYLNSIKDSKLFKILK